MEITPEIMARACAVDEFKGYWSALEKHTTGLNMLSEFAKHGQGFGSVLEQLKDKPISAKNIKALYAALVLKAKTADYKTEPNVLAFQNGEELQTAEPDQVAPLMDKLVEWVNGALEKGAPHPLFTLAGFTAIFLQISPFADQNQRICNILAQILLFKAGYSYAPYVLLEDIINENSEIVFKALQQNQMSLENGRPEWSGWLNTFLILLQDQKTMLERKLNAQNKDLSHLPTLSARVMKLFDAHNRLQMNEIIKMTNGRRATIKIRLKELVDQGYLRRYGQARSTWYSLV